jgi:hypothetical protein
MLVLMVAAIDAIKRETKSLKHALKIPKAHRCAGGQQPGIEFGGFDHAALVV